MNPATGRFWTRDTHPGNNQEPISLHRYLYAHADLVKRVAPSGRATLAGQISVGGMEGPGALKSAVCGGPGDAYRRFLRRPE